jgi:hypothetical protein
MNIVFTSGDTYGKKLLRDYKNQIDVYYAPYYLYKDELHITSVRFFCDREKGERYALHHCNVKKIVKTLIARRAILKLSMIEIMEIKNSLLEAKKKDYYQTIRLS